MHMILLYVTTFIVDVVVSFVDTLISLLTYFILKSVML
jgi:hypothetical protein